MAGIRLITLSFVFLGAAFLLAALICARHVWKITHENLRRRRLAIVQRMQIFISDSRDKVIVKTIIAAHSLYMTAL